MSFFARKTCKSGTCLKYMYIFCFFYADIIGTPANVYLSTIVHIHELCIKLLGYTIFCTVRRAKCINGVQDAIYI